MNLQWNATKKINETCNPNLELIIKLISNKINLYY